MKIAFITSFNADLIKKELELFLEKNSVKAEYMWSRYGAHTPDIYDTTNQLYIFQPNLIFVHYEAESLLGDLNSDILSLSIEERKERIYEVKDKLRSEIAMLLSSIPGTIIVIQNFIAKSESVLGILDANLSLGFSEIVNLLNRQLFDLKQEYKDQLVIQDISEVISKYGKNYVYDSRIYRLAKYPFAAGFSQLLFKHYRSAIDILFTPRKKCIVVDLDNTLWGGIADQNEISDLQLGSSAVGESYVDFQKTLLNYYRRGIYLAICSKNNYYETIGIINQHPDMILRKNHFSFIKINWKDKATNLVEIASELNISIDSLVFLDDDPAECELVRQLLPEVEVVNLTGSPDNYSAQLLEINSLQSVLLTNEDTLRNSRYDQNKRRDEHKNKFTLLDDYYRSLKMQAYISVNSMSHTSRVSQLTQRTNQFNLTSKRYTNEEIINYISDSEHDIYTLRLVDQYGDYGIVVAAIIKKGKEDWVIDTFLVSCRVIARQAETALLNTIIQDAKKESIRFITGEYIETRKNKPAADFFEKHKFTKSINTKWVLPLPAEMVSHFINIVREK